MNKSKALEIQSGLDAASKKRLISYAKSLSSDRDKGVFDDRMLKYLRSVVRNKARLEDELAYLNRINFSQSKYTYSQVKAQIDRFTYQDVPYFGWTKHFREAKERLRKEMRSLDLRMLTCRNLYEAQQLIPRKDTHAGWSYIVTGKRYKGEYFEDAHSVYLEEVARAKVCGSFNKPILIGSRTVGKGHYDTDGNRTNVAEHSSRMVSMVDIYQTMAERQFSKPLQDALASVRWYAGGKDDSHLAGIIAKSRDEYNFSLTVDYSKYDQSITQWIIYEAFDLVREAYARDPFFDDELFKIVVNDFVHKVFIDGDLKVVEAHKGVISGSMFTQIIDSIVNRLMVDTYMNSKSVNPRDYLMIIMGDDNIIFSKKEIDISDLSSYLVKNFGCDINPAKLSACSTKQAPEFLSRYWRDGGRWRPGYVLIYKLLFPERFREYDKYGFTPEQVVQSYMDSVYLGMFELIDVDQHYMHASKQWKRNAGLWLSGLQKYRSLYNENHSSKVA